MKTTPLANQASTIYVKFTKNYRGDRLSKDLAAMKFVKDQHLIERNETPPISISKDGNKFLIVNGTGGDLLRRLWANFRDAKYPISKKIAKTEMKKEIFRIIKDKSTIRITHPNEIV